MNFGSPLQGKSYILHLELTKSKYIRFFEIAGTPIFLLMPKKRC